MNRQRRYGLVGAALVALAGVLAWYGAAGPDGAPTPAGPEGTPLPAATPAAGPRLVFAPEGAMAARPAPAEAPATVTIIGRLLRPTASGEPVLQTFYLGTPPARPAEAWFRVRDPLGLLPAPPAPPAGADPLLALTGLFASGILATPGGIEIGALEARGVTPLTLDETGPARAGDAAIGAAAPQLAAADYAGLALPMFTTATSTWKPQAADFLTGGSIFMGVAADGTPITTWRGAALPAHPDRPQVTRWPVIYALHQGTTVPTLIVTIEGQVDE